MDTTVTVAIVGGVFSLAVGGLSFAGLLLNGRSERRARREAEEREARAKADAEARARDAAERAAEAERWRANTEHWSSLTRRLESDIARLTAERDDALRTCETKTEQVEQLERQLADRTRDLRLAERELDRLRARRPGGEVADQCHE